MRTPRLILASVLAALLALGAWYAWHDANAGGHQASRPDAVEPSPHPATASSIEPLPIVEQRSSLLAGPPPLRSSPAAPTPFFAHRQQMELSGYEAAGHGAPGALALLGGLASPEDRLSFLRGMFTRFGEGHAPELVGVFKNLSQPAERQLALLTLVELWNPPGLAPAVRRGELDDWTAADPYGPEGKYLLQLTDDSLALALARTLPHASDRAAVLGELAWREVSRNPAQALSYGDGIEGDALGEFQRKVVGRWAQLDGVAAWDWIQQKAAPVFRDSLQVAALSGMEPSMAAQRLSQLTGEARAQALPVLASRWGQSDTQAAFNWANAMSNSGEKDAALTAIRSVAPVGIGATLTVGAEGPVIRERVPGGSASGLPQLAEGTTIVAVRDAEGKLIDLKGKDLNEAVGYIRGAPGSMLTMEVIPPGGSSANRQVVIVPRRQLLFKH